MSVSVWMSKIFFKIGFSGLSFHPCVLETVSSNLSVIKGEGLQHIHIRFRSRDWVKNSDLGFEATGSRSRSRNCVSRLLLLVPHFSCLHHVSEEVALPCWFQNQSQSHFCVIFYPMQTRENDFNKTLARIMCTHLISTILLMIKSYQNLRGFKVSRLENSDKRV